MCAPVGVSRPFWRVHRRGSRMTSRVLPFWSTSPKTCARDAVATSGTADGGRICSGRLLHGSGCPGTDRNWRVAAAAPPRSRQCRRSGCGPRAACHGHGACPAGRGGRTWRSVTGTSRARSRRYLERYPEEAALLSEPVQLLSQGGDFASRRSFPMHVTAGALLVRGAEILLVEHRAYGIVLQPGGHLEPADVTLAGAA